MPATPKAGQHNIKMTVDHRIVGTKAIVFNVSSGSGAVGQLQISQGGIAWISKNYAKGPKMPWKKFDEKMSKKK